MCSIEGEATIIIIIIIIIVALLLPYLLVQLMPCNVLRVLCFTEL